MVIPKYVYIKSVLILHNQIFIDPKALSLHSMCFVIILTGQYVINTTLMTLRLFMNICVQSRNRHNVGYIEAENMPQTARDHMNAALI